MLTQTSALVGIFVKHLFYRLDSSYYLKIWLGIQTLVTLIPPVNKGIICTWCSPVVFRLTPEDRLGVSPIVGRCPGK